MKKKPNRDTTPVVIPVPTTWTVRDWPKDVYPHNASRGKRLCLANRDELVKALALTRPNKELVVMGHQYMRWLASKASRVIDYEMPLNDKGVV